MHPFLILIPLIAAALLIKAKARAMRRKRKMDKLRAFTRTFEYAGADRLKLRRK